MKSEKNVIEKVNTGFTIAVTAFSALLFLLFLVMFILTGMGLIRMVICFLWLVLPLVFLIFAPGKLHFAISLTETLLMLMAVGFISLWAPFGFSSKMPWRYNFQRTYIDVYNSASSKDFPDKLPKEIDDYRFEYLASIMQGTGHCSARFTASPDIIKAYESEYAPKAIYTIPLSDLRYGSITVDSVSPEAMMPYESDRSLSVWFDNDYWNDTDATVYVLSATHNWNHPHSSAVIISKDHTKVQFTQLG